MIDETSLMSRGGAWFPSPGINGVCRPEHILENWVEYDVICERLCSLKLGGVVPRRADVNPEDRLLVKLVCFSPSRIYHKLEN
jgi:hypothetical protein